MVKVLAMLYLSDPLNVAMVPFRLVVVVQDGRSPLALADERQPVPEASRVFRGGGDFLDYQLHDVALLADHFLAENQPGPRHRRH